MSTDTYTVTHANGVVELAPTDPRATVCGTCGRAWDDTVSTGVTPTPGGRCPFEYEHGPGVEPSPRWARVDQVHAEYPAGNQAWSLTDAGTYNGPDPYGAPERFALVELSTYGGHWITTHPTAPAAAFYQRAQEYREDWTPIALIDLDSHAWDPEHVYESHVELPDTDEDTLDRIARLLSGVEWEPSHLDDIARLVRLTGRTINDTEGA